MVDRCPLIVDSNPQQPPYEYGDHHGTGECARCGQVHESEWKRFTRPAGRHTHWAICPHTGEPQLITMIDHKNSQALIDRLHEIRDAEWQLLEDSGMLPWIWPESEAEGVQ